MRPARTTKLRIARWCDVSGAVAAATVPLPASGLDDGKGLESRGLEGAIIEPGQRAWAVITGVLKIRCAFKVKDLPERGRSGDLARYASTQQAAPEERALEAAFAIHPAAAEAGALARGIESGNRFAGDIHNLS